MSTLKSALSGETDSKEDLSFLDTLLGSIDLHSIGEISDVVKLLRSGYLNPSEQILLIERFAWSEVPHDILRDTVMKNKLYIDEACVELVKKVLHLNILHFNDFEIMSFDWKNHNFLLTGLVVSKVIEVGHHNNQDGHGRYLAGKIANSNSSGMSWKAQKTLWYDGDI